jgi:ferritin-like protein
MAALVPMKAMCAKMQEVKGDGLPAELKDAWTGMSGSFGKMGELFKDFPDKPADMVGYITKTVGTEPAAIQKWQEEFQTKMVKIGQDGDAAVKKFTETAQKFGIDADFMK